MRRISFARRLMEHPSALPVGTVVSIPVPILTRHLGIVTERRDAAGLPTIVNNSKVRRGVVEDPWHVFVDHETDIRVEGYPGPLPPDEVLRRARACAGMSWNYETWNCEHFIAWAHGIPVRSPQLEGWVATMGLASLLARIGGRR